MACLCAPQNQFYRISFCCLRHILNLSPARKVYIYIFLSIREKQQIKNKNKIYANEEAAVGPYNGSLLDQLISRP